MVEVKSVKVDNWGVFFLQKLQNFFNKTDYCDLTLQFKDNSQLKVHRLVLSACTDFFNVLEMRYNVTDDILVMPKDLQADVVVPIVNFMYTGTLEFEVNMYPRLLKTAKDMNMTVLLKLLDAHKRTVGESLRANQQSGAPVLLNKGANQRLNTYSRPVAAPPAASAPQRTYTSRRPAQAVAKNTSPRAVAYNPVVTKIKTEKNERPVEVRGSSIVRCLPSTSYVRKNLPEPVQLVAKYVNSSVASSTIKGPSRYECSDDTTPDTFESSFDTISYESKPLITARQLIKEEKHNENEGASTSFEKLKRSITGTTKRSYSGNSSLTSPPEKKPNIQDVKEYTEAHRLRKEIVAQELEDDADYFPDDYIHDDDDDEYTVNDPNTCENAAGGSVVIKSEPGSTPVNHAKIISEVLKKYPHLVKNNKNIKLKIMQKGNNPVTVSAVPKEPPKMASKQPIAAKPSKQTIVQTKTIAQPVKPPAKKVATPSPKATPVATPAPATNQPKKIDSRTMHALIAKGAENMTGPWLCLDCGVNGRPISIPSYKGFRRHLINVHKQKIDPRLCEHCGHRSIKRADLYYHIFTKHNIKPPQDLQFPKCGLCTFIALDQVALRKHKEEDHQAQSSQQHCIYCNKTFSKEILLYAHMRSNHKERAQEDGVMDFSEDEIYEEDDADKYVPNHPELESATQSTIASNVPSDTKIKVLSNIALPSKSSFIIDSQASGSVTLISTTTSADNINLEPSSEAEGLSNVASGIATSLAVLDTNVHMDENVATYDDELQSNQYIEAAMANVHGEILATKKEDDNTEIVTKFITEEGSELELTAAQKAELLEQLQDQTDGLSENVVMVLDTSFGSQTAHDLIDNTNNESIVLVDASKTAEESGEWQETSLKSDDDQTATNVSKDNDPLDLENDDHEMSESAENVSADDDTQEVESQDGENKETEDKQKTDQSKASSNLISTLEDDWSDDEMDNMEEKKDEEEIESSKNVKETKDSASPPKKPTTDNEKTTSASKVATRSSKSLRKIVDDSYDSSSSSSTKSEGRQTQSEKNDTKSNDKNLTNLILDDWDSQQSEKFEDDENYEKMLEEKSAHDDESKQSEKRKSAEEKTADLTSEKNLKPSELGKLAEASDKNNSDKKQLTQKSELKTLINDWGDEEEGF